MRRFVTATADFARTSHPSSHWRAAMRRFSSDAWSAWFHSPSPDRRDGSQSPGHPPYPQHPKHVPKYGSAQPALVPTTAYSVAHAPAHQTPAFARHHPPTAPAPHRKQCVPLAGRVANHRHPCTVNRRESVNKREYTPRPRRSASPPPARRRPAAPPPKLPVHERVSHHSSPRGASPTTAASAQPPRARGRHPNPRPKPVRPAGACVAPMH